MPHVLHRPQPTGHALDEGLAATVLVLAGVALVSLFAEAWKPAVWIGLLTAALGLWSQLVSESRRERFETVVGATLGVVVAAVALAHGGFA